MEGLKENQTYENWWSEQYEDHKDILFHPESQAYFNFLEDEEKQVSQNEYCSICKVNNPPIDPYLCPYCLNYWCKTCIYQWLQHKQTCPICRIEELYPQNLIPRQKRIVQQKNYFEILKEKLAIKMAKNT